MNSYLDEAFRLSDHSLTSDITDDDLSIISDNFFVSENVVRIVGAIMRVFTVVLENLSTCMSTEIWFQSEQGERIESLSQ